MFNLIKIEFSRLYTNIWFKIALLIGLIIATVQFIVCSLPASLQIDEILNLHVTSVFPYSLYNMWIGGDGHNMYCYIYFLILPILATVAFADTFYKDRNSGYIKNIFTRTNRINYLVAKYFATFIGGGIVVTLPLIYNFLLTSCFFPMIRPEAADGTFSVTSTSMLSSLFFSHPNLFLLVYGVIIFVFSGLYAAISLIIPFYYSSHFSALITPFLIHIFLYSFFTLCFNEFYAPFWFLQPTNGQLTLLTIVIIALIVLALTFIWFITEGKNQDVY